MKLLNKQTGVSNVIAGILIVIFTSIGASVAAFIMDKNQKSESKKTSHEMNTLQEEINQLTDKLSVQNTDIDSLRQKLTSAKTDCTKLQEDHAAILKENKQLKKQAIIIQKQIKDAEEKLKLMNQKDAAVIKEELKKPKEEQNNTLAMCPTPEIVTQHVNTGRWQDGDINWWITYTQRPILDGETARSLFKTINIGDAVDCYYYFGDANTSNDRLATLTLRAKPPKDRTLISRGNNWKLCETLACKFTCESENPSICIFSIK